MLTFISFGLFFVANIPTDTQSLFPLSFFCNGNALIGTLMTNEIPIRIFPLQKDNNGDKDWVSMGMLATMNWPNDIKVNIRDVFETIPDNVTEEDF